LKTNGKAVHVGLVGESLLQQNTISRFLPDGEATPADITLYGKDSKRT